MLDFVRKWRSQAVLSLIALVLITAPAVPERWGDRLAWTLPAMAGVCAVANGTWPEMALRLGAMEVVVQGSKFALADTEINARPRGGYHGFPSAHSAHAAFGASALVHDCIAGNPVVRSVLIVSAAFTGASRVDAGAHTIWQVLVGWLAGLLFERAFRARWHRQRERRAARQQAD